MDVHRCRFVPYPLSAINAVAFSSSHVSSNRQSSKTPVRLAVGRANGDIEIWNPLNGLWHQETILHGGRDRSIDGLVWVKEPDQIIEGGRIIGKSRLFSIGYTSTLTEWDLEKGCPKKQESGSHSDIWCLSAQPFVTTNKDGSKTIVKSGRKLVAGTMDGSLVLYSIDDGDLRFERVLVKSSSKKTRMVSIAFQNRNTVVVGCSDSCIRVYDMRNGNLMRKMTLGSDLAGGAKEIIVWSVKILNDRDIVSGDSTGQVCIWDGKTYTQAQRLQSHKQDVLSLATSADGSTIVSGGMDRRTVLYRKTSNSRWSKVWHRRHHSHDVKTMASYEGPGISVVVSGGPDANPIVMPLREAGMENHRTLSHLPLSPPLQSAPRARLVVGWWDREIHIWRLQRALRDIVNFNEVESDVSKNRKLLARILIKGEANITSASISDDGSLLLVSTTSDVKAFHLKSRNDPKKDELKVARIEVPSNVAALGATKLKVSPNGLWACVIQEANKVSMLRITRDANAPDTKPAIDPRSTKLRRIKRNIPKHITLGGLGQYDRSVTQITFSADTNMLAVADLAGYIDTWILRAPKSLLQNGTNGPVKEEDASYGESESSDSESESQDDASGPTWTRNPNGRLLPKLHSAPTVLSFSEHIPTETPISNSGADKVESIDDYILLAVSAKSQILTLHPTVGSIAPWSRRNPAARLPVAFRNNRDLVKGALWSGDRVWLYANNFLSMIDMSQDIAEEEPAEHTSALVPFNEQHRHEKKRKRGADTGAGSRMEIGAAGPRKIERFIQGEGAEEAYLDGPAPDPMDTDEPSQFGEDSDSEDSEDELHGELALRRQAEGKEAAGAPRSQAVGFWQTFKYRPILGIVPLAAVVDGQLNGDAVESHMNGEAPTNLEVALVERPLWELDMLDRYLVEGERDR